MPAIPIIDVSSAVAGSREPQALGALAAEIRAAMEGVGFMVIVGHGVAADLIQAAFDAAKRFHAQPLPAKQALAMNEHNNGYMAQGQYTIVTSQYNETDEPEFNEAFFFKRERGPEDPHVQAGRRFVGPNRWPENLPGFKAAALDYAHAMEALTGSLLPAVSMALELPADYFDARFDASQYSVRFSHYPPARTPEPRDGIAPHSDSNFMTFLPQSELPGLEVRLPDGSWEAVPRVANAMAVNAGDTLQRWSNGRFKSTPHRARAPRGADRYAIPFFLGPNIDAVVECLPTCTGPDDPPRWPAITYEQWLTYWYDTNYNHERQADAPERVAGTQR